MEHAKWTAGPLTYRIELLEGLAAEDGWRFPGFAITQGPEGGAVLIGILTDQAAIHGLIRKLRDLGLTLVSLQRTEAPLDRKEP